MLGEPIPNEPCLVAQGVVHDDVDIEARRRISFSRVEKLAEVDGAVARHALADYGPRLDVGPCCDGRDHPSKERRRAVPLAVMGAPLDLTGTHWQQRLGAIEGLDLTLLIDADDPRLLRRVQLQADDIAYFLDELRIT